LSQRREKTVEVKPLPTRRGRPLCCTIDFDAEALLRAMAPSRRSFGALISELIRREAHARDQRHKLLRVLGEDAAREAREAGKSDA
jgi:hypothetical protein